MASARSFSFHFVLCVVLVAANEFLKATPKTLNEHVTEEDIKMSLLEEVERAVGSGPSSRLFDLEETLKPVYTSLPKNEHGNLGHVAVRYALHRMFVARHGWNIKGLKPNVGVNLSSPAGVLKDQVPAYIQDLFETRLAGKGFGLRDLAILAATIEHLIHEEAVVKLGSAFSVHELLPTTVLDEAEADEILDTYMTSFILGEDLNNMTLDEARHLNAEMPLMYLAWEHTQKFVRDIRLNVTKTLNNPALDFALLSKVVESVAANYGSFQDHECQNIKNSLHMMEYRGTGRVKLSDFYKPALDGSWQFQESAAYLRQIGALDESDPSASSVMIANYLHSQTNCIASSGFYSVCCKDECEGLLGHFEKELAAPEATPEAITKIAKDLPSPTVQAPRELSATLLQRLSDIATLHGQMVPLHSRLFAQWMHHAYPRECPYPQTSTTSPEEWLEEGASESVATEEEMRGFMNTNATGSSSWDETARDEDLLPWSHEEELLVVRSLPILEDEPLPELQPQASLSSSMRSLLLVGVAASTALTLAQFVKADSSGKLGEGGKHV